MTFDEIQKQQERASGVWRKAAADEEKFYADVPFTRTVVDGTDSKAMGIDESLAKQAQKGDIITRGYGSTWMEDRDNEYVAPGAFTDTLPGFLSMNPMMLWQHNMDWPLGKFLDAHQDPYGLDMLGLIPLPADREPDWKHLAYHSVARGVVRTKSIGGYFTRKYDPETDKMWIPRVDLMETSIVSIPANPGSIFEAAVKSIKGGSHRPAIGQEHIDQMMQILGVAPMTNPELLMMNPKQLRERYDDLAAYYVRCGKSAPDYEEWHELAKDVLSSSGLAAVAGGGTRVVAFLRKVQGHVTPEVAKGAIPFHETPKADASTPWHGPAEVSKADVQNLRAMCAWVDSSAPDVKGSYKLPHHLAAASHPVVLRGVMSAMGALLGARGGVDIPDADRKGVYNHLAGHYKQFDKEPPAFKTYTSKQLDEMAEKDIIIVVETDDGGSEPEDPEEDGGGTMVCPDCGTNQACPDCGSDPGNMYCKACGTSMKPKPTKSDTNTAFPYTQTTSGSAGSSFTITFNPPTNNS